VELKGIPKALLDEKGDKKKCLKCGKDNHKWFKCWTKEPVIGKVCNRREEKGSTGAGKEEVRGKAF